MNPIILRFADGTTFFVGLLLVLASEGLLLRFRRRWIRPVLTVLTLTGVILVIISATPLPIWAYACWMIPAMTCLVLVNRSASGRKGQLIAYAGLLVMTAGLFLAEIPYHCLPKLAIPDNTMIYVVGDSISAGVGTGEKCWPEVLEEMTNVRVVNLAQAGATVDKAIVQAQNITEANSLVIIEIGGNDLLGNIDANVFHKQLEVLVSSLCADHHQVLVVELPLFPFKNAYGRAQRSVVDKYNIPMLPKRYFAEVLGTQGGLLDGLHLSQEGHNAMANIIAEVINKG